MANPPSPDILAKRRFTSAPIITTITSGTTTLTGTLTVGVGYSMTADIDCFFLQGTASASATASSNPLWAKERADIWAESSNDVRIAVFATSSGTLYLTRYQ